VKNPAWLTIFNTIKGGPEKSKPLPNYQKIILNRIKACQWD